MPLKIRQLCLVCANLEREIERLERVFGIKRGFVDPDMAMLGVQNVLFALGTDFLELVSPINERAPAWRFLERCGEGGYMVVCQVDSRVTQDAIREQAAVTGVRAVLDQRHRDADYLQWHPVDLGGTILDTAFDHRGEFEGYWDAAGGSACEAGANRHRLVRADITCLDPQETARLWAQLVMTDVRFDAKKRPFLRLSNAELYFLLPDDVFSMPRLNRIHLASPDKQDILHRAREAGLTVSNAGFLLCGVEFCLSVE